MKFSGKWIARENNQPEWKKPNPRRTKDKMTNKIPVPGTGCILLSSWPKESHGIPQISQAIVKTYDCSLQPDGKVLLLRTILMPLNTKKSPWYPTRS